VGKEAGDQGKEGAEGRVGKEVGFVFMGVKRNQTKCFTLCLLLQGSLGKEKGKLGLS